MKNFFKFIPPEDKKIFKIDEPNLQIAPMHDKKRECRY